MVGFSPQRAFDDVSLPGGINEFSAARIFEVIRILGLYGDQ